MTPRTLGLLLCALVLSLLTACGQRTAPVDTSGRAAPAAQPDPAQLNPTNPFAGRRWGIYHGPADQLWAFYDKASTARRTQLRPLVEQPKAQWFGAWIPDGQIKQRVQAYIANVQGGDKDVLVQATVYRLVPWQHEACRRQPTTGERTSYRRWIDNFAAGVGSAHLAVVLQPDGPFALCAPRGGAVAKNLVAYAAKKLSALPNTSVYLEVGAYDWPAPGQGGVPRVLEFLLDEGIEHARGVALNTTHYSSTQLEVTRGTEIVQALAKRGIKGKHFVVNTSGNGHLFAFGTYRGADARNPVTCERPTSTGTCITLGIPPTPHVARQRWGLSTTAARNAATWCDGYLWFGRPWLKYQNKPFVLDRALDLLRSTPYADLLR